MASSLARQCCGDPTRRGVRERRSKCMLRHELSDGAGYRRIRRVHAVRGSWACREIRPALAEETTMALAVEPFLTAYDPTDLPGVSIDPLGFERGYLFLADKPSPVSPTWRRGLLLQRLLRRCSSRRGRSERAEEEAVCRTPAGDPEARTTLGTRKRRRVGAGWRVSTTGIRGYRYARPLLGAAIEERERHGHGLQDASSARSRTASSASTARSPKASSSSTETPCSYARAASARRGLHRRDQDARCPDGSSPHGRQGLAVGARRFSGGGRAHISVPVIGDEVRHLRDALRDSDTRTRTTRWLAKYPQFDEDTGFARACDAPAAALQGSKADRRSSRGVDDHPRLRGLVRIGAPRVRAPALLVPRARRLAVRGAEGRGER